jgi:hypothetical protein
LVAHFWFLAYNVAVFSLSRRFLSLLLLVSIGAIAVYFASFLPNADWYETFYPAARGILSGHSPYERPVFLNPPWAVLLLLPFVVFPADLSRGLFFVASILALVFIAWKLNNKPQTAIALLLSPTVIGALLAANLDALIMPAIFLPPVWALIILMIKPQVGFGVALYYFVSTWQAGKIPAVLRTFLPVVAGYILAVLTFPIFWERLLNKPYVDPWNRSVFPYGIPIGLFFLWLGLRRKNVFYALAATPFFAPYHTFYTYVVVQIGFLHEDVENFIRRDVLQTILTIFFWAVMLIFRL